MKSLSIVAFVLVIIGGLNWLLVGAFNFDLVATIFGAMSTVSRVVYVLVGVAALYLVFVAPGLVQRSGTVRDATLVR